MPTHATNPSGVAASSNPSTSTSSSQPPASSSSQQMRILLLGPPGSGKGTQAAAIKEKYNICHLTTEGDDGFPKQALAHRTPNTLRVEAAYAALGYIPYELTIGMLRDTLARRPDCAKGFILEGFPRSVEQARALLRDSDGYFGGSGSSSGGSPSSTLASSQHHLQQQQQLQQGSATAASSALAPAPDADVGGADVGGGASARRRWWQFGFGSARPAGGGTDEEAAKEGRNVTPFGDASGPWSAYTYAVPSHHHQSSSEGLSPSATADADGSPSTTLASGGHSNSGAASQSSASAASPLSSSSSSAEGNAYSYSDGVTYFSAAPHHYGSGDFGGHHHIHAAASSASVSSSSAAGAPIRIDKVISFHASDESLISRVAGRLIHPPSRRLYHATAAPPLEAGRDDVTREPLVPKADAAEVAAAREELLQYRRSFAPVREFFFRETTMFYEIDATERACGEVRRDVMAALECPNPPPPPRPPTPPPHQPWYRWLF